MRTAKWTMLAMATLGVAALGTAVAAQDKAAIVKSRVDFMKALGADNKTISDYAKGAASKEDAAKAIADMQTRNAKIAGLFVAGTSSADLPGVSYAKPAIWTDHDKFLGVIAALKDAESAQADLIKTGTPEAVGAGMSNIGRNGCGACHTTFREKLPG
jgi:cytochrome c556